MGALIGLVNGLLIVRVGIPDLLATLSSMFLLAGLQLIPTGGRSITSGMIMPSGETAPGAYDPAFFPLGRARLWDVVPLPVVIMAVVAVVFWFFMERTRWGRVFYAIGGNETRRASGRRADSRYRLTTYVLSGTLAALGGLIIAARVGRGDVSSGASLLLDSRRGGADRLRRARRAPAQRARHRGRRDLRRHPAQRPDDAERALLHAGLRQGRGAGRRAGADVRAGQAAYVRLIYRYVAAFSWLSRPSRAIR